MFVRLVSFGEGRPNTRRQQPKAALLSLGDDEAQAARVLDALTAARLLTAGDDEREGEADRDPRAARVDLAHEALIEGWPALAHWLGERQGTEQTRRRLEAKVDEWRRLGRGRGGLLDAEELPEFDAWQKSDAAFELGIDPDLPVLVERSRQALIRQRRIRNGIIASLLTLLAVVSGLVVVLLQQRARTEEALAAAVSAAEDVTFSIERDLQTVAGALAMRDKLLRRSNELVARLEKLAGERGDAGRVRAVTLQQQADLLLEQGKLPKALALYQQAYAHDVRQAERDPTNPQWQHDLSVSHGRLGGVLKEAGKLDEARGAFERSLAIRQKLADKDWTNALWRKDLVQAHARLFVVSASLRRRDEAQAHYREAVAQMDALEREGLLREDAQMPKIRAALAALRREHRLAPTSP